MRWEFVVFCCRAHTHDNLFDQSRGFQVSVPDIPLFVGGQMALDSILEDFQDVLPVDMPLLDQDEKHGLAEGQGGHTDRLILVSR